MCIPFLYRAKRMPLNKTTLLLIASLVAAPNAFALNNDKDQTMDMDANYSKRVDGRVGTLDPDITDLDGNVIMVQGSIRIHGDHATIYRMSKDAKDANAGKIMRVVVVGKQAHMQQVHDGDCSLMTSEALTIDYNPITDVAVLTGGVSVVQGGRGDFRGEHMIYNTSTGDMESGDKTSPASRVHIVMEPKATTTTPASTNNCGFPGGAGKLPAAKSDAADPAAATPSIAAKAASKLNPSQAAQALKAAKAALDAKAAGKP